MSAALTLSVAALAAEDDAAATVRNRVELMKAIREAKPGARVLLAPGKYPGGMYFKGVKGTKEKPIVVAPADPKRPPVIEGGYSAFQFSGAEYLELRDLICVGARKNGLNIDGGSRFFRLLNLTVRDVNQQGNHDGIKLSGVSDFRVEDCTVENWGDCGVDMVACARGLIEGCVFRTTKGNPPAVGVQTKGGSIDVTIRRNRFDRAGRRGVNVGGSTALNCFWLGLPEKDAYEAKRIIVEGNVFVGSNAAAAFVTADECVVRWNTIYHPTRWAFRILQETGAPRFLKCRNGRVEDNIIVYRSDQWAAGGMNFLTKSADPYSFRFARNWWYCSDQPKRSARRLPVKETDGVVGKDPMLADPEKGDFALKDGSPAKGRGHTALPVAGEASGRGE